jgi:hypothetical protein
MARQTKKQLQARLRELDARLLAAGERRDWEECSNIEAAQEEIKEELGQFKKAKRKVPDLLQSLSDHVNRADESKKLLAALQCFVVEVGENLFLVGHSDVSARLIDDPKAMIQITICSPANRDGQDLKITAELQHQSWQGIQEKLVAEYFLSKRSTR